MVSDALKPNVQDLQQDVIELLGQISNLMHRASTALSSYSSGEKYATFQQEVDEAVCNVEKLELIMSIVAPMKAGKSTIINAIIGQELLPSRNAAMTTLPTEIVFNSELTEPTLTLSAEILSVFQDTLQDYFVEEDYNRGDLLKKADIKARELFFINLSEFEIFPKWFSRRLKSQLKYKSSELVEFKSEWEAEDFATQAVAWAKQRAESLLSSVRQETGKEIEKARTGLTNFLDKETKPIIERARTRLKEAFNVDLVLPPPSLDPDDDMVLAKPSIRSKTRDVDQGYGTKVVNKRAWYHWLWIVPFEETQRFKKPDKKEDYYTVSLEELVTQINKSIEASVNSINQGITKYLDEDFQQRVDVFFDGLDDYLRNYRDSLRQAQEDQQLSLDEKKKLVEKLSSLVPEATAQINKADAYLERTDQLMPGK